MLDNLINATEFSPEFLVNLVTCILVTNITFMIIDLFNGFRRK